MTAFVQHTADDCRRMLEVVAYLESCGTSARPGLQSHLLWGIA